jgi:hypothetical protein
MIPQFDEHGYLPAGIHPASLDEIDARFGRSSELRRVQMQSLRWLVELAVAAGVQRFVINGSFVTDAAEPNDVDCVLLIDPDFPRDSVAEKDIRRGIPFLEVQLVQPPDFEFFVKSMYASDRFFVPKGMVEIML